MVSMKSPQHPTHPYNAALPLESKPAPRCFCTRRVSASQHRPLHTSCTAKGKGMETPLTYLDSESQRESQQKRIVSSSKLFTAQC